METFDHAHATKITFDTSIALFGECIFIILNLSKHTHHMSMFLRGSWISWSKRENSLGPIRYRLWKLWSSCQAGLVSRTIPSLVNAGVPNKSSINLVWCSAFLCSMKACTWVHPKCAFFFMYFLCWHWDWIWFFCSPREICACVFVWCYQFINNVSIEVIARTLISFGLHNIMFQIQGPESVWWKTNSQIRVH